jgi:hypothetical protein
MATHQPIDEEEVHDAPIRKDRASDMPPSGSESPEDLPLLPKCEIAVDL